MENQMKTALIKAISCLESAGYRYAVIGGIAVQKWGMARFTYAIDLRVHVPDTDYAKARKIIRAAFPEPGRPHLPRNFLVVAVKIDGVIVDFMLSVPGYEENVTERAVQREFDNVKIWICSPEDLIIQKAIAGRAKDWQDIEGVLIEQYSKLDLAYLEDWLSQFAEVLDQPEILSKYQEIQDRTAANRKRKA